MKKLIIIGESHTRSFSYRENVLPFFMGNGKTINLSTKNITKIDSKIKNILSTIDKENSITFLFLGEPNCRYPLKKKWDPHWDEIRNKPLNIPETFDNDINGLLKVCLDYSKLSRNKI